MIILTKEQAIKAALELKKKFPQYTIQQIAAALEIEITLLNVKELL